MPSELVYLPGFVYQAAPLREADLERELAGWQERYGALYYVEKPPSREVFWYRNLWRAPFTFEFSSIKEAAFVLRGIQRNWAQVPAGADGHYPYGRARLIQAALPYMSAKRRPLDYTPPPAPAGSWTLIDERRILASADCASPFPAGQIEFDENKSAPPSRAYLKLAEAFARIGFRVKSGERCLDAGASPGGWSWYLSNYFDRQTSGGGAPSITAIDRAALDPKTAALENITFVRHDAFTLKPEDIGTLDWIFCDAAVYPDRLYNWIERWLTSGLCARFVCTLKMHNSRDDSGADGMETVRRFASIAGSKVIHLYHNKHELTWIKAPELNGQ